MVSLLYVGAVAIYFLVLYPYIIKFVSWAAWAIEGLPPPSYNQDLAAGRLVPAPYKVTHTTTLIEAPADFDHKAFIKKEILLQAKEREAYEMATLGKDGKDKDGKGKDIKEDKDCALKRSTSWIKSIGGLDTRRTRLDRIMERAAAAEEGHAQMETIDIGLGGSGGGGGGDGDEVASRANFVDNTTTRRRSFSVQPRDAQFYNGASLAVNLRVFAGQMLFHGIFCALPFYFKYMHCSFTQQLMLPINMHDQ